MDTNRLAQLIGKTTVLLRKGAPVRREGNVVTIQSMPHEDEDLDPFTVKVNLTLVSVAVLPVAATHRSELIDILRSYPEPERMEGGPSYIEVGGVIGDQGLALRLFALGHVLKLWRVITPETLGVDGEEAKTMAGIGYVMINGYDVKAGHG